MLPVLVGGAFHSDLFVLFVRLSCYADDACFLAAMKVTLSTTNTTMTATASRRKITTDVSLIKLTKDTSGSSKKVGNQSVGGIRVI